MDRCRSVVFSVNVWVVVGVCLAAVALMGSVAAAESVEAPLLAEGNDGFAEIVDFVVSRDPVLAAQRTVMEAARALDIIRPDDGANVPSYAQTSLLQMRLDSVIGIQQAQQTYANLQRSLVSSVFANLTKVFTLRNQIVNNQELLVLLQERLGPTERQVQAGIVDANVLWGLSERIISVQISIADAQSQLVAVERETALNYGGEDWRQLLRLIQDLR